MHAGLTSHDVQQNPAMVDISALMHALPVSAVRPGHVAWLSGIVDVPQEREWEVGLYLLEPPTGQCRPYLDPERALSLLLRHHGMAADVAQARAQSACSRMRTTIDDNRWVTFFDYLVPDSPECVPVADFTTWLRAENDRSHGSEATGGAVSPALLNFLDQSAEVASRTPMFSDPDNRSDPWSLETLPALPPPNAMFEYLPGPPWNDRMEEEWTTSDDHPYLAWREAMRPIAQQLEAMLGAPVFYFGDLSFIGDDDGLHRFLMLHWCCSYKPASTFVRFLMRVSGARDVEELKAALIDPAHYSHAFRLPSFYGGVEARCPSMDYRQFAGRNRA